RSTSADEPGTAPRERRRRARAMRWPGSSAEGDLVAELRSTPLDVLDELLLDGVVERGALVLLEERPPSLGGAVCVVGGALPRPPVVVVGRRDRRPPEAVAEALERVGSAEEVTAVADLHVGVEREARVVDGDGCELGKQEVQQLE